MVRYLCVVFLLVNSCFVFSVNKNKSITANQQRTLHLVVFSQKLNNQQPVFQVNSKNPDEHVIDIPQDLIQQSNHNVISHNTFDRPRYGLLSRWCFQSWLFVVHKICSQGKKKQD